MSDDNDDTKPVRRMTVSELIRESKPDWQPVRTIEKRSSTRPYSGPLVVTLTDPRSIEEQVDEQNRQNLGLEEPWTFWEEEVVEVDDSDS